MRILLLRHAESLGNVDELAYCRIPDHALPLTTRGEEQARAAGPVVRELLGPGPVAVYVSPYVRTQRTLQLLDIDDMVTRTVAEPRLREQDWGNLQDPVEQEIQKLKRHEFGHFFYRLAHGESGADVDDRVAAFLAELKDRMKEDHDHPDTVLLVTHGLTMRLLCRRVFSWSIDLFESLSNPNQVDPRILTLSHGMWTLDRPFPQWRPSPDGTTQ
ncbi:histidine phosphatase family protein [Kibdelosporangium phytohabitans]|uniref:Phosphoglycerate mutase n=1 Tax=Kibdelosporangium phytohabitans TaxID=860235 RepID=A0A0N9HP64_9PSEU|nr:histidine phosphatase family protein [Kibdelosporangium phytohabitans]ALG06433.1 phosphoglycerate mutase [Kibdelosporangium phytohabitans]MBE1467595.1 broad specificity phosphatase PhoE [Kibdelosporangium phytohabitans]